MHSLHPSQGRRDDVAAEGGWHNTASLVPHYQVAHRGHNIQVSVCRQARQALQGSTLAAAPPPPPPHPYPHPHPYPYPYPHPTPTPRPHPTTTAHSSANPDKSQHLKHTGGRTPRAHEPWSKSAASTEVAGTVDKERVVNSGGARESTGATMYQTDHSASPCMGGHAPPAVQGAHP